LTILKGKLKIICEQKEENPNKKIINALFLHFYLKLLISALPHALKSQNTAALKV